MLTATPKIDLISDPKNPKKGVLHSRDLNSTPPKTGTEKKSSGDVKLTDNVLLTKSEVTTNVDKTLPAGFPETLWKGNYESGYLHGDKIIKQCTVVFVRFCIDLLLKFYCTVLYGFVSSDTILYFIVVSISFIAFPIP